MENIVVNAYCPECAKRGKKKLLFRHSVDATGTVNAYCKICRKEVTVELKKSHEPLN